MDCLRVQENMSAYLDGILTGKDRIDLESHLLSCGECQRAFSELKKTVECLRGTEMIEPPPWLKRGVMARIHQVSGRKSVWQRIFFPLHIKIPLEAIGAILIAVTTWYAFQNIRPHLMEENIPEAQQLQPGRIGDHSTGTVQSQPREVRNVPSQKRHEPSALLDSNDKDGTPEGISIEKSGRQGESVVSGEDRISDRMKSPRPLVSESPGGREEIMEAQVRETKEKPSEAIAKSEGMPKSGEEMPQGTGRVGVSVHERGAVESRMQGGSLESEMKERHMAVAAAEKSIVVFVKNLEQSSRDVEAVIRRFGGEIRLSEMSAGQWSAHAIVEKEDISKVLRELSKIGTPEDNEMSQIFSKEYRGQLFIVLKLR